jgi:hypothetical protein
MTSVLQFLCFVQKALKRTHVSEAVCMLLRIARRHKKCKSFLQFLPLLIRHVVQNDVRENSVFIIS